MLDQDKGHAVANRKRAEEALTFLANASTSLAALVDRESALQQAARLPIPFLADWCVVYVVDGKGGIDYHAHAHINPEQDRMLGEMLTDFDMMKRRLREGVEFFRFLRLRSAVS